MRQTSLWSLKDLWPKVPAGLQQLSTSRRRPTKQPNSFQNPSQKTYKSPKGLHLSSKKPSTLTPPSSHSSTLSYEPSNGGGRPRAQRQQSNTAGLNTPSDHVPLMGLAFFIPQSSHTNKCFVCNTSSIHQETSQTHQRIMLF